MEGTADHRRSADNYNKKPAKPLTKSAKGFAGYKKYGDKRARTADLFAASEALSQLSYTPKKNVLLYYYLF